MSMKIFYLKREEDESGISGTGRVAQGFVFDNGKVAVTWLSEHPSVTIYDSIGEVHAIHGHGGKTEVVLRGQLKVCTLGIFCKRYRVKEDIKIKL